MPDDLPTFKKGEPATSDDVRKVAAWFEALAAHNEEAAARLATVSPNPGAPERGGFLNAAAGARGIAAEARAVAEELEELEQRHGMPSDA